MLNKRAYSNFYWTYVFVSPSLLKPYYNDKLKGIGTKMLEPEKQNDRTKKRAEPRKQNPKSIREKLKQQNWQYRIHQLLRNLGHWVHPEVGMRMVIGPELLGILGRWQQCRWVLVFFNLPEASIKSGQSNCITKTKNAQTTLTTRPC